MRSSTPPSGEEERRAAEEAYRRASERARRLLRRILVTAFVEAVRDGGATWLRVLVFGALGGNGPLDYGEWERSLAVALPDIPAPHGASIRAIFEARRVNATAQYDDAEARREKAKALLAALAPIAPCYPDFPKDLVIILDRVTSECAPALLRRTLKTAVEYRLTDGTLRRYKGRAPVVPSSEW